MTHKLSYRLYRINSISPTKKHLMLCQWNISQRMMQFYLASKLFFYLEELCDSEGLWKFIDKYGIPFSVWVWTKISNSNDESQFNFNLLLSPINKFYFWSNKTLWLLQFHRSLLWPKPSPTNLSQILFVTNIRYKHRCIGSHQFFDTMNVLLLSSNIFWLKIVFSEVSKFND